MTQGVGSFVAIAWAIADDVLPFHYLVFSPDKTKLIVILKLVGEIRKAFSPFDWSIFLMKYLLAIAAATLLRAVATAGAIAQATVIWLRLVAQAIAGIATSELGQG